MKGADMMAAVSILVGLGLVVCGIIIARAVKKRRGKKTVEFPPPLPPRGNAGRSSSTISRPRTRTGRPSIARLLPPRRSSAPEAARAVRRNIETGYGPRGIKPSQFPCCPFDKQRNLPGEQQVIFWDSSANCYRCSRGHQFKSNGKLL